jgi:hypothetical protein
LEESIVAYAKTGVLYGQEVQPPRRRRRRRRKMFSTL